MSFKETKELRQAGKLDEALQLANKALEIDSANIWNKRAAAWVFYEFMKQNVLPISYELFKENLIKIKELQLPEDEKMIFDSVAWQVGKLVFELSKITPIDHLKINELFDNIKDFHFTKPSDTYSFIYKAFHKSHQNWTNYLTFADWWSFENFRDEDYANQEINGKKIMSIAEQAYIVYSKKLLEGESSDPFGQQRAIDKEKIQSFLPKLDSLIEKHPDYQYPPYFKAKLLLALGNDENVLSAFLPFAKQKRNDFWVWELMAEIFSENKEVQFSCYCKALSLKTREDFLVKLRLVFAEILIEKNMYNEAKTEIQKIIETREKHEWRLPNQIVQWTEQEWFKSAIANRDNFDLYFNFKKQAEEILFQDKPEELIVVEFVNSNKGMLNFMKDKTKKGFFKYEDFLEKPCVGDILKVRFKDEGTDGYYKILTAKEADENSKSEMLKYFNGTIRIRHPQNIGFIDDVFFDTKTIEMNKLTDKQMLSGKALLSFNKKKNEWSWKAIKIR